MRIIGIDPGLTRCGVGVVSVSPRRKVTFEHVEVVTSAADTPLPERLLMLGEAIGRILDGNRPDALAIERVFAQQNLPSVMGVAQISGVVMFLAAQRGIPVTMYTPSEVKAQVTGYGNADKGQVTRMVTRLLGLDAPPKPADAADALALAITHAWQLGRGGAAVVGAPRSGISAQVRIPVTPGGETPAQRAWREAERRGARK
ncbi:MULTISPECIES: crossover junction endodeoxyribonuclease RuvC [unclassified Leucobacter]|uniref:crossover junction endodeoxyribonuclease RuvC n=1 Tax=unclassified Leucobacter TaxID=2621730 RepID=UPI00165DBC58|nr:MULTISPECIES: crossover junction endodeoxyribonuclease RuvC [unclassified Leucobacter]MBC9926717.1 crossover junction endodeoxyribonuclease RuvC [Leucobacter sp. cx-169]MBC9935321.1 crossover junction endodeoxyribonuclease RuvC [Leucobacter sp. cx-87]